MRIPRPRGWIGWTGAGAAGVFAAAILFVWIAPYNIAARLPHLPGVGWLLHTYMRSAVKTWSTGIEVPAEVDLDDPALIRLGAGHFETGCAPCHGAPGRPPNPLVRGMRPAPPSLRQPVTHYDGPELYWLVRNGLKYTGMPAWSGEHRDDEPWALAAFLLRYPALEADVYEKLAYGESGQEDGFAGAHAVSFGGLSNRLASLEANCARCHGADGGGRNGTAPKLAGQSREFLAATLNAYAEGNRSSGIMEPIAAALSQAQIARLAGHYAAMPPFGPTPRGPEAAELHARGAELARRGTESVPSCAACHGTAASPPRQPAFPRIAGQSRRYLAAWLRLWRERPYGGTAYAQVMHESARWLSDEDIEALSAYFAAVEIPR